MLVGPISIVTPVQLPAQCRSTHARSGEELKSGDEGANLRVDLVQRVFSLRCFNYASDFAEGLRDGIGEVSGSGFVRPGRNACG